MIRVLITLPEAFDEELHILEKQAENFDKIHLRKNNWSESETISFLNQCSVLLLNRLVLCDHYELTLSYPTGGIHLKEKKRPMNTDIYRKGTISSSFHQLETLCEEGPAFDYALFGPAYLSFSKENYTPSHSSDEIREALEQIETRVVGIGGVSEEKQSEMQELGYSGLAFYTSFWKNYGKA
jgi:thiamine-phosphate pyrophosphorylase